MSNVNINALKEQADTLASLVERTNATLGTPVSTLATDYTRTLSQHSSKVAYLFSKFTSSGRIDQILVGGAVLGVAYVGAKGIDIYKNAKADAKAREQLLGYYQELTVKHSMLINEQQKIISQLVQLKDENQEEKLRLQQKLNEITDIIQKIADFNVSVQK